MREPLGVAVIGCAHRPHAWSYARSLSACADADLLAVHDPDPDLGHSVADDFGAAYVADLEQTLAIEGLGAVVVCAPTVQHRSLVEAAAERDLHVLCEKPLATTADDGRAMVDACARAGVQLHTAFVSRFHPGVRRLRALVAAGEIGDLVSMVGGNRGVPPLPPAYPAWITDPDQAGGGALIDHAVHVVDVMRHLSGREVDVVSAECGSLLWDCGVDDVAQLTLSFGGVVAGVDPSWSVPPGNPWDYDFFLRLLGTRGSVDLDDLAESIHLVSGRHHLVGFGADVDAALVDAFVTSVRTGEVQDPCATGEDGLRALEVALAAYQSSTHGRPVRPVGG